MLHGWTISEIYFISCSNFNKIIMKTADVLHYVFLTLMVIYEILYKQILNFLTCDFCYLSVKYYILRDKQLIFIFLLIISNTLSEKVHIGIHCYLLPLSGGKLKKKYCLFSALCAQYCCIQHQYIFQNYEHNTVEFSINKFACTMCTNCIHRQYTGIC